MNSPRARRQARDLEADRGSATLELVIWAPVLLIVLALVVFAGRLVLGHQSVEQAAADAARQASISRTAFGAQQAAQSSATNTLAQQGLRCVSNTVVVDTAGFNVPVGLPATVTATVTCVIPMGDLAFPGLPGSKTVTATATSPLDTYRGRSDS